jgi:hypothetical protein
MNYLFLIVAAVPVISITMGMWFGRDAPHKPEYNAVGYR